MAIQFSTAARNGMMDAITTAAGNSGILRIYTATRPANPGTAAAGTLLAELTCNATFAAAASGGVLTLGAITNDSSANATGTAAWFRLFQSNGTTAVLDGDVGTSGSDLNLNTTSITSGGVVSVTSFTLTAPGA